MTDAWAAARKQKERTRHRSAEGTPAPVQPLTLDDWRALATATVDWLVRDYGEAGALRILNGPPKPEPTPGPPPFDPALLAPVGAVGIPRRHGGRAALITGEVARW